MTDQDIVQFARKYAAASGVEISTLGRHIADDGKFFKRLELGATVTLRRANEVLQWFSDHWPDSLDWPDDIHRPEPTSVKKEVA